MTYSCQRVINSWWLLSALLRLLGFTLCLFSGKYYLAVETIFGLWDQLVRLKSLFLLLLSQFLFVAFCQWLFLLFYLFVLTTKFALTFLFRWCFLFLSHGNYFAWDDIFSWFYFLWFERWRYHSVYWCVIIYCTVKIYLTRILHRRSFLLQCLVLKQIRYRANILQ